MAPNSLDLRPAAPIQSARKTSVRIIEHVLHFLAYHFILKRQSIRMARVSGFRLTVGPTVFDPRYFLTSEFFANFILSLKLTGKRVADVGTGSGILALAAAKAGAAEVVAIDINPNAVATTTENARANGLGHKVIAVTGDMLSSLPADDRFDVILTNPPFFEGQPRDVADRAWCAGRNFSDIASLFQQIRERLAPGGRVYVVLSSKCNMLIFGQLIEQAKFRAERIRERSYLIESIIIYELLPVEQNSSSNQNKGSAI